LPLLYLGTPTAKALIWQQHDTTVLRTHCVNAGFTEPQSLPALPGEVEVVRSRGIATAQARCG